MSLWQLHARIFLTKNESINFKLQLKQLYKGRRFHAPYRLATKQLINDSSKAKFQFNNSHCI